MQGYIIMATGQQKYLDMAVSLAKSIRFFDKQRRICLFHDERLASSSDAMSIFDDRILLPNHENFVGCANKIRIYNDAPYEHNMYIDADCLMVKSNIDECWNRAMAHSYFSITGAKRKNGIWNKMDISKVCGMFKIDYVVAMNAGVFYFRKCADTNVFFEKVTWLYDRFRHDISNIHQNRQNQYADEPLFGTAMGLLGLSPVDMVPSKDAWMVSTWRSAGLRIYPEASKCVLWKPKGYWFDIPIIPRGWVELSPTLCHFISLKPHDQYRRAVAFFERAYNNSCS